MLEKLFEIKSSVLLLEMAMASVRLNEEMCPSPPTKKN